MALSIKDQHRAMKELSELFLAHPDEFDVAFYEAGKDNVPTDVLMVTINDYGLLEEPVTAQYIFSPENGDEDMFFIGEIVFTNDIKETQLMDVFSAINAFNSRIPCGAFNFNEAVKALAYRISAPINMALSYEEFTAQVEILATQTMAMGERYSYLLSELAKGNISLDECLDVIPDEEG